MERLATVKLDTNPIVVDKEDADDCATERTVKVLDNNVEYSCLISIIFDIVYIRINKSCVVLAKLLFTIVFERKLTLFCKRNPELTVNT